MKKDGEKKKLGFSLKASHFENDEDSEDDLSIEDDESMEDVEEENHGIASDDENFVSKLKAKMGQDDENSDSDDQDDETSENTESGSDDSSESGSESSDEEDNESTGGALHCRRVIIGGSLQIRARGPFLDTVSNAATVKTCRLAGKDTGTRYIFVK